MVQRPLRRINEGSGAPCQPQQHRVDPRRWIEVGPPQLPGHLGLPPRLEEQRRKGFGSVRSSGKALSCLPLDHAVHIVWWRGGVYQTPDDRGGLAKRDVAKDLVRGVRKGEAQEVAVHQLDMRGIAKRVSKPGEQLVVKLDGDEMAAALGQLTGQNPPPRTDLNYEVPAGNGGLSD